MQKMGPLPLLIQLMWKPLRPQDELWTRSSISQYQVGWKRKEAGTRFGSVRGPANERPGRGMAVVAFLAGPAFPCLAMPGAHPTPPHHTTSQVAACLPFLSTANTSPCPSEPSNKISQFCVSLKGVFSDLSRKEQDYSCQTSSLMSSNLFPIHP